MKIVSTKIVSILLAIVMGFSPVLVFAAGSVDCADMDMDMSSIEMTDTQHMSMNDTSSDRMNCHMDQCDMSSPCSTGTCAGSAFLSTSTVVINHASVTEYVAVHKSGILSTSPSFLYRPPRA